MTRATEYVNHMYSQFEGRAAVSVGVNIDSETIYPFVYENKSQMPIGLIAMSVDNISNAAEVDIYHISAFKPGNGQGSEIMNYICNAADEFEVRLCIQATALYKGRRALAGTDLVKWYRKFGFNGNDTMYRDPD